MTQVKVYEDDALGWFVTGTSYADYILDLPEDEAARVVAAQVEWDAVQKLIEARVDERRRIDRGQS